MKQKENANLPTIDITRCSRCGVCVLICPTQAISLTQTDGFPQLENPQDCTLCAQCEEVCPSGAISLPFVITWGDQSQLFN